MTNTNDGGNDPLNFVRNLWGNMGFNLPGMVTPTFDVNELEKRINDLKAVEGWLRMNLSMLQMTIQGLEMQRATLSVVQAMGDVAHKAHEPSAPPPMQAPPPVQEAAPEPAPPASENEGGDALSQAALWPWTLMQQVQEAMQEAAPAEGKPPRAKAKPKAKRPAAPARKPAARTRKA